MQNAVLTETHHPAKYRSSRKTCRACFQHDHLIERFVAYLVAFTDKDSKQITFFRNRHAITFAKLYPSQTSASPARFETATLTKASNSSPSRRSVKVCNR